MAELDEDNPSLPVDAGEVDLGDEVVDYRLITSFAGDGSKIPKRGLKDFESHGTTLQASTLEASRDAMRTALSLPRVHLDKARVVGIFNPDTGLTQVPKPSGVMFRSIGHHVDGHLHLLPEESLYLLERGTLDIRWPKNEEDGSDDDGDDTEVGGSITVEGEVLVDGRKVKAPVEKKFGLPMSLQGAYAAFLGMNPGSLTLERYLVYTSLRRAGYIVLRAPSWDEYLLPDATDSQTPPPPHPSPDSTSLWQRLFASASRSPAGPLVTPGLYRSYQDIYRMLNVIPFHNPKAAASAASRFPAPDPETPYRVAWHVHKPGPGFKKTAPGTPDFRVAVVAARENRAIPQLPELDALLASTPFSAPDPDAQLYHRLKHGYRNVVLGVVDAGIINWIRVGDCGFGLEPIYVRPPIRGGKGKGGRGGGSARGRGRGRGRGK